MTLSQSLNAPDQPDYKIEESIWRIISDDNEQPVTLSVWFRGDKRYGVLEVFWKCSSPPEDIDNHAAILDLIWDETGMSSHDFEKAKFIRVYDEKVEDEVRTVFAKLESEDLDDLQLILSLAQITAESLDENRSKPRFSAIDRWQSRAFHGKARKQTAAR